jgi:hypothetical protein
MNKTIFVDLDGVIADFDYFYTKLFVKPAKNDAIRWSNIKSYGTFFLDVPKTSYADNLMSYLNNTYSDVIFLSSSPKSFYEDAARQKNAWVKKHFPNNYLIPMLHGEYKYLFMKHDFDILIDDFEKNCKTWIENNGIAIKHNSYEETIEKLKTL